MAESSDQLAGALQQNTLTLLCVSDQYCQLVRNSVPVDLFSTFLYRDIVNRVYAYIDKYKEAPKAHLPDLVEDLLAEKGQKSDLVHGLLVDIEALSASLNQNYVVTQLERFTRQQKLKLGVVEATKAIQDGDLDKAEAVMEKAMKDRLRMFDPGMSLEDVYEAAKNQEERERIMTGIPALDVAGYGPARKELHVFLAPLKRGKTWWMLHLAKRAVMQGWKALCITLEMSKEQYGARFLQSLFSMTKREIEDLQLPVFDVDAGKLVDIFLKESRRPSLDDVKEYARMGGKLKKLRGRDNIIIKEFPTHSLTTQALKAYLDALESQVQFIPDLLLIDYPELMDLDLDNYRLHLGRTMGDLRGLGQERNIAVGVVAQTNRAGTKTKTVQEEHVGEDLKILQIADTVIAYNQTEAERELKVARLFVLAGRGDYDKYSVLITQAYEIGQFALDSRPLDRDYWALLEKKSGGTDTSSDKDKR